MTSNFESHNPDQSSAADSYRLSSHALEMIQRDRFEMLSAYLDGEVTADERRQVEEWLANDPTVQQLHSRLLKLRHAFQTAPVPTADEQSIQQTVDAVFARIERRPRLSLIWGGVAIAALAVGAVTNTLLGERSPLFQSAQVPKEGQIHSSTTAANSEPLLVALDKPLVAIPKTPVADPGDVNPNAQ
jgi:anti-sigma factor RsiW